MKAKTQLRVGDAVRVIQSGGTLGPTFYILTALREHTGCNIREAGVISGREQPFDRSLIQRVPVAWSRDGDQWVARMNLGKEHGRMEARITRWDGPLGAQFNIEVRGSDRGGCGGGDPADALARAKAAAVEYLAREGQKWLAARVAA